MLLRVKDLRTDPVHSQPHRSQMGDLERQLRTDLYFILEIKAARVNFKIQKLGNPEIIQ